MQPNIWSQNRQQPDHQPQGFLDFNRIA